MREGFTFNKFFIDFQGKNRAKHFEILRNNRTVTEEINLTQPRNAKLSLNKVSRVQTNSGFYNIGPQKKDKCETEVLIQKKELRLNLEERKARTKNKLKSLYLIHHKKNNSDCFASRLENQKLPPLIKFKDMDPKGIVYENSFDKNNTVLKKIKIHDVFFFENKFVKKPFKF